MRVYCLGSGFPEAEPEGRIHRQVIQYEMLPGETGKAVGNAGWEEKETKPVRLYDYVQNFVYKTNFKHS